MDALQSAEWRELVRRVKTCAELLNCVTTLLTKGVDWTCARQLFPITNGHSGKKFSCSESYLLSADGLLELKNYDSVRRTLLHSISTLLYSYLCPFLLTSEVSGVMDACHCYI